MWELDCEEGWTPKNWCFWTVVLEKTLESPLNCKEIQPVHSEGDQPWDFFAVQGTLNLLQHHSSKATILQHSTFFIVQLSHPLVTTRKTIALTRPTFVGKVMSLLFNMLLENTWKDPDAGKDWGQEEKGTTEDEMVGWHHRLHGYGFGWTPGVVDVQGGLACYSS